MKTLDSILSNAAINAIILAIYCITQIVSQYQAQSYLMVFLCAIAAVLCVRDAFEALTYKH